jgi:hypothetical protein
MRQSLLALLVLSSLLQASDTANRVLYVGGTVAGTPNKSEARIDVSQEDAIRLTIRNHPWVIPYGNINAIEYGLRISRHYAEAVLISPIFLFDKKKTHFLTLEFTDADRNQQAVVLQVSKAEIRPLLVSLEARTGRRVEYQDEEARKAGKE